MGKFDTLIGLGILGVGVVVLFYSYDTINEFLSTGLIPPVTPTPPPSEEPPAGVPPPPGTEVPPSEVPPPPGTTPPPPSGTGDCKALCSAKDCSGYDAAGCTKGCSACKSSARAMAYHAYQTYYY